VGHVVTYRHDPLFTYAVGDATKSYSSAKLRLFLRHFLFLPPNLFVVFDQVTATDPGFRKAWLLHSVGEPQIANGVVTIADGPGRLVCRTVRPERAVITKVGGPGKECWVEGRNWPPVEREWTEAAGAWRTEVSPSLPAAEDLFLHVLEVDGDEIASSGNVSLVRESGRVGVRVHAQGRDYLATFPLHGGASGRLQITENAKVLLDTELR
jgi:heparin/heparan-sulfate lyase